MHDCWRRCPAASREASSAVDASSRVVAVSGTIGWPHLLWRHRAEAAPGLALLRPLHAAVIDAINLNDWPWRRYLNYPTEADFYCPTCRRPMKMHIMLYDVPGTGRRETGI